MIGIAQFYKIIREVISDALSRFVAIWVMLRIIDKVFSIVNQPILCLLREKSYF